MINNSLHEYFFIRTCIAGLRAIGPLCTVYSFLRPFIPTSDHWRHRLVPLDVYAGIEAAFLLFVYLPLNARSQRPTRHPPLVAPSERSTLFKRCINTTNEYSGYLRLWFRKAELAEIKKENVKEFFAWAFLNKASPRDKGEVGEPSVLSENDAQELEQYAGELEAKMERTLSEGYGEAKSLRLTLDEVRMTHRPFLWYSVNDLFPRACL